MSENLPNGSYRMAELERRVGEVEKLPTQVSAMNVKIDNLSVQQKDDQRENKEGFKSLRTALVAFSLSIAGSAIIFAFAVLQLVK